MSTKIKKKRKRKEKEGSRCFMPCLYIKKARTFSHLAFNRDSVGRVTKASGVTCQLPGKIAVLNRSKNVCGTKR